MASYIQININTANAPHFATWYHNRSGQANVILDRCRTKLRIKRQFLLIGYAPKDIPLKSFQKYFRSALKAMNHLSNGKTI